MALDKALSFLCLSFCNREIGVIIPDLVLDRQEQSPAEPFVLSNEHPPTSVEGREDGTRLQGFM